MQIVGYINTNNASFLENWIKKVWYFRVSSKFHPPSERSTCCHHFAVGVNWKHSGGSQVPLLTGTAVRHCQCVRLQYRCSRLVIGNQIAFKVTFISFCNTLYGFCCYSSNGSLDKGHFAFARNWQKLSKVMLLLRGFVSETSQWVNSALKNPRVQHYSHSYLAQKHTCIVLRTWQTAVANCCGKLKEQETVTNFFFIPKVLCSNPVLHIVHRQTHRIINPLALQLDIYSLAQLLCKMWIFYEPRRIT